MHTSPPPPSPSPAPPLPAGESLGDGVQPATYHLFSTHPRSRIYLPDTPGAASPLFAVAPAIGPGPLNWVLPDAARNALPDHLDLATALPAAPRYDSTLPSLPPGALDAALALVRRHLPALAPADSLVTLFAPTPPLSLPPFQRHCDDFLHPHLPALRAALKASGKTDAAALQPAIRAFRGCGTGSTPSGDDFLSGFFLAYRLLRRAPPPPGWLALALGANPISNAFLALAHAGRVHAPFHDFLLSPTLSTLDRLLHFGHTSGADLLSAFLL